MTHIGTPIAMPQGSYYLGLFFTTVFVVSCPLPSSVISLPFINLNLIVVETPSRSVSDCSPDIWQPFLFSLFLYSSYISYEYAWCMHCGRGIKYCQALFVIPIAVTIPLVPKPSMLTLSLASSSSLLPTYCYSTLSLAGLFSFISYCGRRYALGSTSHSRFLVHG